LFYPPNNYEFQLYRAPGEFDPNRVGKEGLPLREPYSEQEFVRSGLPGKFNKDILKKATPKKSAF
jgi:hypothetical protein